MSGQVPHEPAASDELAAGGEGTGGGLPSWAWRVVGLAVVTVVAALAGPGLLSSGSPAAVPPPGGGSGVPATGGQVTPPVPSTPLPAVEPLRWAARGPQAHSAFADQAVVRLREERPDADRLLWAGTLDGSDRVAVVSYRPAPDAAAGDGVEVGALRVPAGVDVSQGTVEWMGQLTSPDGLLALAVRGPDSRTRLLVLGQPGPLQAQVSAVLDYHPSGRVSRRWHDLSAPDGHLVTDLGPAADPTIVVRPAGPGFDPAPTLVPVLPARDDSAPVRLHVAGLGSATYAGPDRETVVQAVARAVAGFFDARDAEARVLWSGALRGGVGTFGATRTGRGALVRLRRPDGAVFRTFVASGGADDANTSYSVSLVPWAVADLLPYTFSTYDDDAPLLLINPGGAGSATLRPVVGPTRRVRFDRHGVAVLAKNAVTESFVNDAKVTVRDPAGRVLLRSSMGDPAGHDMFGLYG